MKFTITGKSLKELYEEYGVDASGFYSKNPWWMNEKFAQEKPEPGDYEISTEKALTNLTYKKQEQQLPDGFSFPHPAVIAEAILSHYKKTGIRILEDWYTRTSSIVSFGDHVDVGHFHADGLHVSSSWDDYRSDSVGVSAARKFSEPGTIESSNLLDAPTEIVIGGKRYKLTEL